MKIIWTPYKCINLHAHRKLQPSSLKMNMWKYQYKIKCLATWKTSQFFVSLLFQVLYIQAFVLVFLLGKFMRKVFFGQLRAAEMEVKFCLCLFNSS